MRKLLFLLLIVLIGNFAFAQTKPTGENEKKKKKTDKFLFGLVGYQLSKITGEDSYDSPLSGFVVGFGVILTRIGENGSLRTALVYSQQGSKYKDMYAGDGKVMLAYLNLPITARFATKSGFYGEGGLQPGLVLSAKDKYQSETFDFKDQVNTFDLGIPLGIGYQFKNGFDVGARCTPGLLNLNKEGSGTAHNLTFGLNLGYTF